MCVIYIYITYIYIIYILLYIHIHILFLTTKPAVPSCHNLGRSCWGMEPNMDRKAGERLIPHPIMWAAGFSSCSCQLFVGSLSFPTHEFWIIQMLTRKGMVQLFRHFVIIWTIQLTFLVCLQYKTHYFISSSVK